MPWPPSSPIWNSQTKHKAKLAENAPVLCTFEWKEGQANLHAMASASRADKAARVRALGLHKDFWGTFGARRDTQRFVVNKW